MQQYKVTFSIYRVFEPGKATIGSSLTSNMKTIIAAQNMSQARAMIEAQYGKTCSVHGVMPL